MVSASIWGLHQPVSLHTHTHTHTHTRLHITMTTSTTQRWSKPNATGVLQRCVHSSSHLPNHTPLSTSSNLVNNYYHNHSMFRLLMTIYSLNKILTKKTQNEFYTHCATFLIH